MKNQTAEFIQRMADNMLLAQKMSSDQLADEVREIWAGIDMSSKESSVLSEVMSRLMGLSMRPEAAMSLENDDMDIHGEPTEKRVITPEEK